MVAQILVATLEVLRRDLDVEGKKANFHTSSMRMLQ